MGKYLKEFELTSQYEEYINSTMALLPNVSLTNDDNMVHYNPIVDYIQQYLTFEAIEDSTFSLTQNTYEYSLDEGKTWVSLSAGTNTPTVNAGSKIMFKATNPTITSYGIGTFSSTGKFNISGNIMSMLYGDDFVDKTDLTDKDYVFCKLFNKCTNLVEAHNLILPTTILAVGCYSYMFQGCTSLTTAPELPATTLDDYCYSYMLAGCTSLTTAPELPATTLAEGCYQGMFELCTSLTTAPELPATTLTPNCYYNMFSSCRSLTTAPELSATTLAIDCYSGMFKYCTELKVLTKSEFIVFNDIDSGFEGILKDCYMPKNQNVIINLSDSDEIIFNYSDGIYGVLREEIILSDILSQEDIITLTPEYDLVVTVYDNYPDPHIVNTPNICEHITWEAGQSLEEFAEKFNFDYNHTSISILYTSRKGGDYYYYYD